MYAAHASTVSAIRVGYYSAANARATDEAAAVANRNESTSYRFEEARVEDVGDNSAADDVSVGSVSSSASFSEVLDNLSARMWSTPSLRPAQAAAITEIMHGRCGGKLLLVHRTGGGKSHILRMVGSLVGGIVVVIVPLLTLCADQIRKILEASPKYASCEAQHIDDCSTAEIKKTIIPRIDAIGNESSSVMFIFISPQKLNSCGAIRAAILRAHLRKTLRLVAIDEAHLYAIHGRSFRGELRLLHASFFENITHVESNNSMAH